MLNSGLIFSFRAREASDLRMKQQLFKVKVAFSSLSEDVMSILGFLK